MVILSLSSPLSLSVNFKIHILSQLSKRKPTDLHLVDPLELTSTPLTKWTTRALVKIRENISQMHGSYQCKESFREL
jgi:hypothetical protein